MPDVQFHFVKQHHVLLPKAIPNEKRRWKRTKDAGKRVPNFLLGRTTIVGTGTAVFHCNDRPAADCVADTWLECCAHALDRAALWGTAC